MRKSRGGVETVVLAILVTWILVRVTVLSFDWIDHDSVYGQYRSAFNHLEAGSTLFSAAPPSSGIHSIHKSSIRPGSSPYPLGLNPPKRHIANLAILQQQVFVPQIFSHAMQQPLNIHPDFRPLSRFQTNDPLLVKDEAEIRSLVMKMRGLHGQAWRSHGASSVENRRAYFLWLSADRKNPAPDLLRPIRIGPDFQLFEIVSANQ